MQKDQISSGVSRREFMRAATGLSVVAMTSGLSVLAQQTSGTATAGSSGSDVLKIGLVGCGGRGLYDTTHYLRAAEGLELVAMGDLFADRMQTCLDELKKEFPDKIKVTPETMFTGFDAYKKVLATDINIVIFTTPPFFRPMHLRAALEAGKHTFVEKPVAVDPIGVRSVIESAAIADQKNLTVLAGTQARRMQHRVDMIKRIQDGDIGEIVGMECIRIGDGLMDWGMQERTPQMTDMEWQIRRWLFQTWLSGDFIVEQHVHELDIVNWIMGGLPEKCHLLGGRQARTDEKLYGNVYDHFSGHFEYKGGVVVSYNGAQIDKTTGKNFERIHGTKGIAYTDWALSRITGSKPFEAQSEMGNAVINQFKDQVQAIRTNTKLNEAKRIAESSLTAIFARMSAYTGRELKWDWAMNASKLDLTPARLELGPYQMEPVAIPGKTQLV